MDFINDILQDKAGDFLGVLTAQAGFRGDEAETFLPEAGKSVAAAVTAKADDLDFSDIASAANIGTVLKNIDIASLAGRTGLTAEQGSKGLAAMLPMLLGLIGERGDAGALLGTLGKAQGLGDAMGKLKGLGKLFG